jgi:hypothetical protein
MRNRYGFSCSWFYSSVFAFDRVHKNGSDFPRTIDGEFTRQTENGGIEKFCAHSGRQFNERRSQLF